MEPKVPDLAAAVSPDGWITPDVTPVETTEVRTPGNRMTPDQHQRIIELGRQKLTKYQIAPMIPCSPATVQAHLQKERVRLMNLYAGENELMRADNITELRTTIDDAERDYLEAKEAGERGAMRAAQATKLTAVKMLNEMIGANAPLKVEQSGTVGIQVLRIGEVEIPGAL